MHKCELGLAEIEDACAPYEKERASIPSTGKQLNHNNNNPSIFRSNGHPEREDLAWLIYAALSLSHRQMLLGDAGLTMRASTAGKQKSVVMGMLNRR